MLKQATEVLVFKSNFKCFLGYILLDHISRDTVYFQAPSPHLEQIKPNLPYLPSSSRSLNIKVNYLILPKPKSEFLFFLQRYHSDFKMQRQKSAM